MTKLVISLTDGTRVNIPLTAVEEAQLAKDKVTAQAIVDAQVAEEAKKVSGKQKLKDLGLDDEEIKALTGK